MSIHIENLEEFKFLAHKVMPLVYDESLSYYEFLAKVIAKLNEVIDNENEQNEAIETMSSEIDEWEESAIERYNEFTAEIDTTIAAFTTAITNQQTAFETSITTRQTEYEDNLTDEWEEYSSDLTERQTDFEDDILADFQEFLTNYQRQFGVVQTTGTSTTDVMSQKAVTDELASVNSDLEYLNSITTGEVNETSTTEMIIESNDVEEIVIDENATEVTLRNTQIFEPTLGSWGRPVADPTFTLTNNDDGTYTLNGRPTASTITFNLNSTTYNGHDGEFEIDGEYTYVFEIISGDYTLDEDTTRVIGAGIKNGTEDAFIIGELLYNSNIQEKNVWTDDISVENTCIFVRTYGNVVYNNLRFRISVNRGTNDEYVEYKEPTTISLPTQLDILEEAEDYLPNLWIITDEGCTITAVYYANKISAIESTVEENTENISSLETQTDTINKALFTEKTEIEENEIVSSLFEVTNLQTSVETSLTIRNTQICEPALTSRSIQSGAVTITNNGDGTYTINGTATANAMLNLNNSDNGSSSVISLDGNYSATLEIISGSMERDTATEEGILNFGVRTTASGNTFLVGGAYYWYDTESKKTFNADVTTDAGLCSIRVRNGVKYDNLRIRLTVAPNDITEWCEYKEPVSASSGDSDVVEKCNEFTPNLWVIAGTSCTITVTGKVYDESNLSEQIAENAEEIYNLKNKSNIVVINHKGLYAKGYPENTLWAFCASKLDGFDWVETDIRLTSDGIPVLIHDTNINTTGREADGSAISETIAVNSKTYAELETYDFGIYAGEKFAGTKLPKLRDFLVFAKQIGLKAELELKVTGAGTAAANVVKECGMEDNVIFIAYDTSLLAEAKAVIPKAGLGVIVESAIDQTIVTNTIALKTSDNYVYIKTNTGVDISAYKSQLISNDIAYGLRRTDDVSAVLNADDMVTRIMTNYTHFDRVLADMQIAEWSV